MHQDHLKHLFLLLLAAFILNTGEFRARTRPCVKLLLFSASSVPEVYTLHSYTLHYMMMLQSCECEIMLYVASINNMLNVYVRSM
jgi:hypothetical protein